MIPLYILDACALIAFLQKETGWEQVKDILLQANKKTAFLHMHNFNLLEVYYDMYRNSGKEKADEDLAMIRLLPITFNVTLSDEILLEAGRLKATYKISLADAVALAQANVTKAPLLTADHHEFDIIEEKEPIKFFWIR